VATGVEAGIRDGLHEADLGSAVDKTYVPRCKGAAEFFGNLTIER
jgi:hypothetical protein